MEKWGVPLWLNPPTLYKPNAVTTPQPRLAHHTDPYCHVLATVRITNVKDAEGTLIETEGTPGPWQTDATLGDGAGRLTRMVGRSWRYVQLL